jgi:hypothetical protein
MDCTKCNGVNGQVDDKQQYLYAGKPVCSYCAVDLMCATGHPYRTAETVKEKPMLSFRERLPRWQDDATNSEVAEYDRLVLAYIALGNSPGVIGDEDVHHLRARYAVETADYAMALRRRLLGKRS